MTCVWTFVHTNFIKPSIRRTVWSGKIYYFKLNRTDMMQLSSFCHSQAFPPQKFFSPFLWFYVGVSFKCYIVSALRRIHTALYFPKARRPHGRVHWLALFFWLYPSYRLVSMRVHLQLVVPYVQLCLAWVIVIFHKSIGIAWGAFDSNSHAQSIKCCFICGRKTINFCIPKLTKVYQSLPL